MKVFSLEEIILNQPLSISQNNLTENPILTTNPNHQNNINNQRNTLNSARKTSSNYAKSINNHIGNNNTNMMNNLSLNLGGNTVNNQNNNNNPQLYNGVNYITNNDLSKSFISNNFFEFKISNFCEIFNLLIKENILYQNINSNPNLNLINQNNVNINNNNGNLNNNIINNYINQNNVLGNNNSNTSNITQVSAKNIQNNIFNNNTLKRRNTTNFNNFASNNSKQNSSINNLNNQIPNLMQSRINLTSNNNINNIFTFDLQNFFYENNLNYQIFVDLLSNINSIHSKENTRERDFNKTKYLICLAKCNKTHNITRWPITNYDITISPRKYFFVIEAEENMLNNFIDDYKFIYEKLNKTEEDTFTVYNQFVYNKLKIEINNILVEENSNKNKLMSKNLYNSNANVYLNIEPQETKKGNLEGLSQNRKSLKNTLSKNQEDKNINEINMNSISFDKNQKQRKNSNDNVNNEYDYIIKYFFVSRVLPEGIQKGLLIIYSNKTVKYKPIINNYKSHKKSYTEIKLSRISHIVKYRYLYRYKAINLFLYQSQRSKIFDFDSENEFHLFYNFILNNSPNIDKSFEDLEMHTNLWKFGSVSNFEYLMYLNIIASRSFSDLSQYPIFPWVISNYEDFDEIDLTQEKNYRDLSKPIGALAPYKLERFLQNYSDMKKNNPKEIPFIYSEHYSNPGHIIYYLVRSNPLFQMKYKNGSLGPPERLFNSIKDCWNYILNINNEVKELIPEFYCNEGSFLLNTQGLNFGETNSGVKVDDVVLPKWAKSASHFININRAALESKCISNNLHLWIDLIFGSKQKEEAAVAANNLYYFMTYESALEKNCDKNFNFENEFKKQAFYTQLSEYGQIPKTIFDKPHPKKKAYTIFSLENFISDMQTGNKDEIMVKIESLVKENKKLEEDCVKLEKEKREEKEMLFRTQEEIELKRKEKIRILKE